MSVERHAIAGGVLESYRMDGGPGTPLVVLGGVETGMRPLAGTESVLERRWGRRAAARPVVVLGRPIPDDPSDAERVMHPRLVAEAVASVVEGMAIGPVAIEAESGGGRISLWLTVEHPAVVDRLVLAAVASESPPGSPMSERMAGWIEVSEAGDWGAFFSTMARSMQPGAAQETGTFAAAARLQPKPATPERFIAELRATLHPSSFVTARLGEIAVPTLVLVGQQDRVVPPDASRLVAERIPGARLLTDPACGHTVRASFAGYDEHVEAFLAEGD